MKSQRHPSLQMGRNLACHTAQKEATRMTSHASKILVAISLDSGASLELLSRGIELLASPNDIIVALHVLVEVGKVGNGLGSNLNRFRKAKASVISILGELMEASIAKQVRLEAKVRSSSSIGKGIEEEAILLDADFLLLGGTRRSLQNSSYLIAKQCLKSIPESCSVVAMGRRAPHSPPQNPYSFSTKKLARSKDQKKQYSSGEGFCCESSPASTMDLGSPELRRTSAIGFHVGALSRANVWRRISMPKFLSLFRSEEEMQGRERRCEEDDKPSWRCFSHDEISCATNNFHSDNLVGRGGHSEVFKGTLGNGSDIAVKRLSKNSKDDKEKKFLEELGILGHISHPNTSSLIGCCFENGFHLIFNFCPNGSLSSALHGRSSRCLDWATRHKIAVGIARGLHYLHKGCPRRIIHRDIKASNVLLGQDYEPQISDFGLAKWLPKQLSHHSVTPIEGTFGYLAPEYFMHGMVDEKTDVFAFGVLLLEILTGKRPIDTSKQSLLIWAKPLMEAGRFSELADPRLEGKYDEEELKRLVLIASYCIRSSPLWRPYMTEVQQLLSHGNDLKEAESWRMTESQSDDFDDFSTDSDIIL